MTSPKSVNSGQTEREAFEAELAAGTFDVDRVSDFANCETEAAWRGWQTRAAAPQGLTDERINELARTHLVAGDDGEIFGLEKFARALLAEQSAAPMAASLQAPAVDEYKRMFEDAVRSLAAIDEALGIDPDEAGGAEPILEAIAKLKNERDQWVDANYAAASQAPAVDGAEGPSLGVLKATHEGFSFVPHPNAPVIPYEGMSVYAAPLTREAATVPLTERQIVAAWATRFNYVEDRNAPNAEQIGFYRALLAASSAAESKTLPRASEQADEAVTDAAISACALMIKGTCMTKSQDEWTKSIEERIRFMLKGTRK